MFTACIAIPFIQSISNSFQPCLHLGSRRISRRFTGTTPPTRLHFPQSPRRDDSELRAIQDKSFAMHCLLHGDTRRSSISLHSARRTLLLLQTSVAPWEVQKLSPDSSNRFLPVLLQNASTSLPCDRAGRTNPLRLRRTCRALAGRPPAYVYLLAN